MKKIAIFLFSVILVSAIAQDVHKDRQAWEFLNGITSDKHVISDTVKASAFYQDSSLLGTQPWVLHQINVESANRIYADSIQSASIKDSTFSLRTSISKEKANRITGDSILNSLVVTKLAISDTAKLGYRLTTEVYNRTTSDASIHNTIDSLATAKQNNLGFSPESIANKGINNGYAMLDGGGKVPISELPSTLQQYLGVWDATTNTPTLTNSMGNPGNGYQISMTVDSVQGSWFGQSDWFYNGDYVIKGSLGWEIVQSGDGVKSVNGQQHIVNLTTTNIPEGSNLYFTTTRAQSAISGTLPISISRPGLISILQAGATSDGYLSSIDWNTFNNKQGAIATGTTAQYWRGDETWQTLNSTVVGLGNVTNNAQVTTVNAGTGLTSSGGTTPTISIASGRYLPTTTDQTNWNLVSTKANLSGASFTGKITATAITTNSSTVADSIKYTGYGNALVISTLGGISTFDASGNINAVNAVTAQSMMSDTYYNGIGTDQARWKSDTTALTGIPTNWHLNHSLASYLPLSGGTVTGTLTATSFTGAATGLTGTAASMNIGGTASNITSYPLNQSVSTNSTPTFVGLNAGPNYVTGYFASYNGSIGIINNIIEANVTTGINFYAGNITNSNPDAGIRRNSLGVLEVYDGNIQNNQESLNTLSQKIGTFNETALSASIIAGSYTSISVIDTQVFPATGTILIGGTTSVTYTSKTQTSFIFTSTTLPAFANGTKIELTSSANITTQTTSPLYGTFSSIPVICTNGFPTTGTIVFGNSRSTGLGGVSVAYTSKDATNFYIPSQTLAIGGGSLAQLSTTPGYAMIDKSGNITGTSFSGSGTGLTGTAAGLNIGGTAAGCWSLSGNAGTTPGTNFIGTTDNEDVIFKRNGVISGCINSNYNNTSLGVWTFNNSVTSTYNTAIGSYSLYSLTTGSNNTSVGAYGLASLTTGSNNTSVGAQTLQSNTGSQNTAIGATSMFSNTTGTGNTAIGFQALINNTTGTNSTAIGNQALSNNLGGSYNTAMGNQAGTLTSTGSNYRSGSFSFFLGANTKALRDSTTNENVIGNSTVGHGSNTVTIGNTSVTANYFNGSVNAGSFVNSTNSSTSALMSNGSTQIVTSGTYTPSISNETGLSSISVTQATYTRIGNIVHVNVTINANQSASVSGFSISLPFSTNNTSQWYVGSITPSSNLVQAESVNVVNTGTASVVIDLASPSAFGAPIQFDYIIQ
jgi:hypothetical protein